MTGRRASRPRSRRSRCAWPPAAATRRPAPRRTPSSSRSCRGGPRGRRPRRSTPCSPRSAQSNPDVNAVNGAVAGGAGSNAIVELAKRLQAGDPPDVWQTFAGKSVQGYASRGVVRSVASVFDSEELRARMNPTILRSLMRGGQPYGVPTGAHRSNVLWFNTKLLEQAGVTPAVERLHARRVPRRPREGQGLRCGAAVPRRQGPVHHGRAVREHAAELDRDGGWADMVDDDLDWRGDQVQTALKSFGTMLGYSDPQASRLTWDQATKKLAAGGCAFESMNDSAFGELVGGRRAARARTSARRRSPAPTRASSRSSTSSSPRRRRRTPRTRSRSSAASASPRRSSSSTRRRARSRSCATSTSRR